MRTFPEGGPDASTRVALILGRPVAHSLSPLIHNAAFRVRDLNYTYAAANVAVDSLPAAVEGLRALGFVGANVTVPHKQAVAPLMDELSVQAADIGAVNTIVIDRQGSRTVLKGDNTDVAGFCLPLDAIRERLAGGAAVVLGAGGAARAVVYGLLARFSLSGVFVVNRTAERSRRLVADLERFAGTTLLSAPTPDEARRCVADAALVVNATTVGMYPDVGETPWSEADLFNRNTVVYDLVYNPVRTRLLAEARERGAFTIDGTEMLLGQAAAAFEQWTGEPFPADAVRPILLSRLEEGQ